MSAYKKMKCNLVDKSTLLQSLQALGFSPIVYEEPTKLVSYAGDNSPAQKAEIVIPKEQFSGRLSENGYQSRYSSDLGFAWDDKSKQYIMVSNDVDNYVSSLPKRVKQAYAKIAIESALRSRKFAVKTQGEINNRTRTKVKIQANKVI